MTELTDERLLSMAAKALGYASIDPERGAEEGPGSFRQALEVFPEELIAFARAVLAAEPPAPAPAADGEREELAQWLYCLADERSRNRRRGIRPHPSALRRAAALLRQNDGTWDLIGSNTIPGPNGPLNKADMEAIWAKQCRPVDTGLVYSTGPAVDLVKADEAMRKFSREPWDLPPPTNTTHPTPKEPPTDD